MDGDQTLNVVIKAKDQASATLDKLSGKVSDLGPTIKKMALIGVAAFATVAAGAYKMLTAYADAEAQTVITNQSLSNSFKQLAGKDLEGLKKAVGSTQDALKGLIEAADKAGSSALKLGFDDETAARSFAKLFAITKDVTKSNNELAIAEDLARFKGITLEEATQKLVLVHSGATKELKALGIAVNDTATIEQNLQSIHEQTANSADKFSKTTKGAMETLGVQVDNLKEQIGKGLAPAFTVLVGWATNLVTQLQQIDFNKIKEDIDNFLAMIDEKTGIITLFKQSWDQIVLTFNENLMPALAQLWEALKPLEPLLTFIAKIIGGILIIAIKAIVLAITGWIEILTNIIALASEFAAAVIKFFTKPINDFIDAVKSAIDWVSKLIDKIAAIGGSAVSGVKSVGKSIGSAASKVGSSVGNFLGFEHGGMVPGAIGQAVPIIAHGGEIITPASRSGSTDGLNIVLNLNYPQFKNQDDIEVVRSQIDNALRDVIRIYKLQPA